MRAVLALWVIAGCGRVGFDPLGDAAVSCPNVRADAGAAIGMLRVVATADNGYTVVSRSGGGALIAQTPAWNPTSSNQIYFECEQFALPATTSELYVVAGNLSSLAALYLHADLDTTRRAASSTTWETCDTGTARSGTQPAADVAAFVTAKLPGCAWVPATAVAYIAPECACDGASGVSWIWGASTANWQLFRAPTL